MNAVDTSRVTVSAAPNRLSFSYSYVVGYGSYGADVPDDVLGPVFTVGLVDAATGGEIVVYTSPELSTYDYDTCGDHGGWGEHDAQGVTAT